MKIDNYGVKLYDIDDAKAMKYDDLIALWEEAHKYLNADPAIPFETRKAAVTVAFSGELLDSFVTEILPPELQGTLASSVLDECYYVVTRTTPSVNGKYNPTRITMHPKTAANLERGSRRYGAARILAELNGDF